MKKFLILFFMFALTITPIFANTKDSILVVKNTTPTQIIQSIYTDFAKSNTDKFKLDEVGNVIYETKGNIYIKAYENDSNTELYIITNSNNFENIVKTIKENSFKTFLLNDKASLKKFKSDYLAYASEHKFEDVKIHKKQNSLGYREYNPYMGKFRNKVIEKQVITQNNIKIQRTQLKPKVKVKHYANEYIYEITNNTKNDILINKVASEDIIGLSQIAAYCMIPRGMDFVPIWGTIYAVQTDLEKNKFTRPHPVDETIKKNNTMRVLVLSKKAVNPVVDFYFTLNNTKIKFTYDSTKGEKL